MTPDEARAKRAAYMREYMQRPHVKCKYSEIKKTREYKAKKAVWRKAARLRNPEVIREKEREYKARIDKEVRSARRSASRSRRADKIRDYNRAYAERHRERDRRWKAEWEQRNPGKVCLGRIRRKAAEARAVPAWVDRAALNEIYRRCDRISTCLGMKFHVDHIVPLRGRHVCGLHVPWNLQLLPAVVNMRKSNKVAA